MVTNNTGHLSEVDGHASSRLRVDVAHTKAPSPHIFELPDISDIRRLVRWLDSEETSISDFGERLARYDGLSRYVVAMANHSAAHPESSIRVPTHAAAFLGLSGLKRVLTPLTVESSVET